MFRSAILGIGSILLFPMLSLPLLAAPDPASDCTLCSGSVDIPSTGLPVLIHLEESDLPEPGDAIPAETRANSVLVFDFAPDPDYPAEQIETRIRDLVAFTTRQGVFGGTGLRLESTPGAFEALLLRRLSVAMQGAGAAHRFVVETDTIEKLDALVSEGALPYFDSIIVPAELAGAAHDWIERNDPAKELEVTTLPSSPNPLYDIAIAFSRGARRAWSLSSDETLVSALRELNSALSGDMIASPSSPVSFLDERGTVVEIPVVTFIRGEDLSTVVVPRGRETGAAIMSASADDLSSPRILSASGTTPSSDSATERGRTYVGIARPNLPHAVIWNRTIAEDPSVTREAIEVATRREIPVEEIIRNHQAYWDYQIANQPRWIATNQTSLRFPIGATGDLVEATINGPYFFDAPRTADWVWESLFINGVRWKYGRVPELPLVQPEKVTELPLELNLGRDYRYRLVRETTLAGYDVWEIQFEPPISAPEELPLYKGRVWIDMKSFARIAISMIQLNLGEGEVLSNEERLTYAPFDRTTEEPLSAEEVAEREPEETIWLLDRVNAQQTLSAAGAAIPVQRETLFVSRDIGPDDFEARLAAANDSDFRMIRETDAGLRYLERTSSGERVVKEGVDSSRFFLVGGLQHDEGLEYGVLPLAGINYFDFNLFDRGLQTNIFFAGVFTAANLTNPSIFGTRANASADFFGLAIPFKTASYRDGVEIEEEAVEALPVGLTFRVGHPFAGFGKVDLSVGMTSVSFGEADSTADDFIIPTDTIVISPQLSVRYDRWGYSLRTFAEYNTRTEWEPWGNPDEYSDDQKSFFKYGIGAAKTIHLPNFQRIGFGAEYVDGTDLDRFSKYELGFFGSNRVRGFSSGSIKAESAIFSHFSYGFVISDQLRLEAFYDHAMLDDTAAGWDGEAFQGVGVGGQTLGPWGTILRLDVGRSLGSNAQDGIVASIVFLKILD
ncbi:MAG: hypothetical protein KY459_10305 [Acidobacteria bacterium]|nr:hypothetical protein [Acidobacteriota bacterium]